ncbi:thrombospondin type 3 repeat-containing protein [Pseudomonadales bacterium]|nr:thrombospondin type 3 repeat-containing protein [Pseudomonadales bacterium]
MDNGPICDRMISTQAPLYFMAHKSSWQAVLRDIPSDYYEYGFWGAVEKHTGLNEQQFYDEFNATMRSVDWSTIDSEFAPDGWNIPDEAIETAVDFLNIDQFTIADFDDDDDGDGVLDSVDAFPLDASETLDTDSDGTGNNADTDDDNDGVEDTSDAFPLDFSETADSDNDGVGDNSDAFPDDAAESVDSDSDSVGDNADNCPSLSNTNQLNTDGDTEGDACDSDDDNDGFSDDQEELDGTNPKSRFSCRSGCFSFDVDENLEAQPLTDGLLVIRHLFGFSGDSLISGAVDTSAERGTSELISGYLTDAVSELDIDGDGESKPLTDGLLLIRYLFGFSGDSLISGAIGDGAERDTAEEVEAYIEERVPVQ